jgi:UPF0042 nucleotide-binding protein
MMAGSRDRSDPCSPTASPLARAHMESSSSDAPVVLVTGLSGAGRSRALKTFEDLGFEAVDNLPIALFRMLVRGRAANDRRVAIGIDTRTRDFTAEGLLETAASIRNDRHAPFMLFLDCDDDVLIRRYTETRRRHPMADDRPVSDGIQLERALLAPLRDAADLVVDTSALAPGDLQRLIQTAFASPRSEPHLTVTVASFSFRRGLPREADLVFDARFLHNPFYVDALRPLNGRDPEVAAYIERDADFAGFFDGLTHLLAPLLPRYLAEGKSYLTIAVGCTGGQHRSVFVAERLAAWLVERHFKVGVVHRDVDRHDSATTVIEPAASR